MSDKLLVKRLDDVPDEMKLRLYLLLAHHITIRLRTLYSAQDDSVRAIAYIKYGSFNELMHILLGQISARQSGRKGYEDATFIELLFLTAQRLGVGDEFELTLLGMEEHPSFEVFRSVSKIA